ncbi:MAG TPA: hypothetical protein VNS29_15330 [Burkholderiaceae bacterium]|nr:hypothetical protein [Burkholderiaceae bacterium]
MNNDQKTDWYLVWWYLGIFVGVPLLILLGKCGFADNPTRCSSAIAISLFAHVLYIGAFSLSGWLGFQAHAKTHRVWLGWLTFLLALIILSTFLIFSGVNFPAYNEFEYDWL